MNLETLLADPTLDLPVPLDGLTRVDRRARTIRRRRKALVAAPALAAVAVSGSLFLGGSGKNITLYGTTASPSPTTHSPRSELLTFCAITGGIGGLEDIAGPTGNPVTNCEVQWKIDTGQEAPPLLAYQNRYGAVEVYPATSTVPPGYTPLPPGNAQDPAFIAIDEALGDTVDGLYAACLTQDQALSKAGQVLAKIGIRDWPVRLFEPAPGVFYDQYPSPCWVGAADARDHTVRVSSGPNLAANQVPEFAPMMVPLRPSLTQCWDRATADRQVRDAIAASGFSAEAKAGFAVRHVTEPGARCTTIHVNAGGNVVFTLRGPA
jgi:hypothetical protein